MTAATVGGYRRVMRIGDVLKAKPSRDVVTIGPDAGVRELLARLSEHNVGALIVSADGATVDGNRSFQSAHRGGRLYGGKWDREANRQDHGHQCTHEEAPPNLVWDC